MDESPGKPAPSLRSQRSDNAANELQPPQDRRFISDKIKDDAKKLAHGVPIVRPIRRRDREFHNPYTDTYPAGVMRPDKVKHVPSDETGGPPLRT